ncbi:amidohydrolase family protein [Thalassotalea psychrophila]|uniref:Amidohydrolase family protein n=1 Tax=Thalassotalea psychrophila TaxID=3065647 RepID=A0ABY9TYV1_9GAMM|nr:amidohydrolase family protein [Colwelliaceae bacterium SQ149]
MKAMKIKLLGALVVTAFIAANAQAAQTLFKNVNVFNGTDNQLYSNLNVLVDGNKITSISAELPKVDDTATLIDGTGKTLMPGLIESHTHLNLQYMQGGYNTLENRSWQEVGAMAAGAARHILMDGYTTIRDLGTLNAGFRNAADAGLVDSPRIYTAGTVIGQTAGHGDWRLVSNVSEAQFEVSNINRLGFIKNTDGADEVLKAARNNYAQYADFTKLTISGGIFSDKDPLFTTQMNEAELKAAVEAADAWDSYVTAHVFNDKDVRRAMKAGLKMFEHTPYITDDTAKLMAKNNIMTNPQFGTVSPKFPVEAVFGPKGTPTRDKADMAFDEARELPNIIKRNGVKAVFGVDVVTVDPYMTRKQRDYEIFRWGELFDNFYTLKALTSYGGELAALTGKGNPYPGKIGVVEVGAYADLLLVDGNPLEDLSVIGAQADIFSVPNRDEGAIDGMKIIMKDGKIYKNTL